MFHIGFDDMAMERSSRSYHQRFWNQLLAIIMERPFALNQNQLSMDAGSGSHDPGKAILSIRLRDNIKARATLPVWMLIWKGEQVVATIPLTGTDSSNGLCW